MKIGFIGLGNMAQAMIGGMIQKKLYTPDQIIGSAKTVETAEKVAGMYAITTCTDNTQVAANADVVILAVKPVFFAEVIEEIKEYITPHKLIISIAAGKSISWIEEAFGKEIKLIRCMPNTPALVGEGCTGVCLNEKITKVEEELAMNIMNSFGKANIIPERMMDAVIGVSGSAPAYVFLFIEAMADAAVAAGMPRKPAYEFAAQTVLGSAKMVLETGKHPGELKDMVCSPGGTTIEAVKVLEQQGFRGTVMSAIDACVNKSKNM